MAVPKTNRHAYGREGQAMAEFLVGLVAIMFLLVGIQQIALITRSDFAAFHRARRELAENMMDSMSDYSSGFIFSDGVDPGRDLKRYTADDTVQAGDDAFFTDVAYFDFIHQGELSYYQNEFDREEPYDRISDSSMTDIAQNLEMLHGGSIEPVDVVPFLRRLIGQDVLNMNQSLWMPKLEQIKE